MPVRAVHLTMTPQRVHANIRLAKKIPSGEHPSLFCHSVVKKKCFIELIPGPIVIKLFSLSLTKRKKARAFVFDKPRHPSLIFASKSSFTLWKKSG
jgi:hypothetical protein